MLNHFFIIIYYSYMYYYVFINRAMNCQQILKILKSMAPPFWNYGKTRVEIGGHRLAFSGLA